MAKNGKKAGVLLSRAALKRRYPSSGLASEIYLEQDKTLYLPSRILALNHMMGGGIPYGKIVEVFGEESTGKSLLAYEFAYVCQQMGGIVLWNDAETSFDPTWARKHGVDPARVEVLKDENIIEVISDWWADMMVYYRSILKNNEPILFVGDSIAAWDTNDNMEAADSGSGEDMGRRSKKIYQMVRKRNKLLAKYGVCALMVNQLRKKVGATKWEDPDTTPGGKAMAFYASIRLGLYRSKQILNEKEIKVGQKIYVTVKKNKVAPPRPKIYAEVLFTEHEGNIGYSKYAFFIDVLVEEGIVKKKQGLFYLKDTLIAKGESNFKRKIETDKELRSTLIKKLKVMTVTKAKERIANTTTNLYPVNLKVTNEKDVSDNSEGDGDEASEG